MTYWTMRAIYGSQRAVYEATTHADPWPDLLTWWLAVATSSQEPTR